MTIRTAALAAVAGVALLCGCAHRPARRPPAPAPAPRVLVDTMRVAPTPPVTRTEPSLPSQRSLAARDTAYVSGVLRRCGARTLLPDQESTRDALRAMLDEARAALLGGDLEQARSVARNARQLASSLRCR